MQRINNRCQNIRTTEISGNDTYEDEADAEDEGSEKESFNKMPPEVIKNDISSSPNDKVQFKNYAKRILPKLAYSEATTGAKDKLVKHLLMVI